MYYEMINPAKMYLSIKTLNNSCDCTWGRRQFSRIKIHKKQKGKEKFQACGISEKKPNFPIFLSLG